MTEFEIMRELVRIRWQFQNADDEAYGALTKAMQAIRSTKWTPVTDDLPENDGEYLVTVKKYNGIRSIKISRYWRDDLPKWTDGCLTHWAIETGELFNVLAWMPKPPEYMEK